MIALLLPFFSAPAYSATSAAGRLPLSYAESALQQLTLGKNARALQDVEQALMLTPDDPLLQSLYGAALLRSGETVSAAQCFRRALKSAPEDALAHYGQALCQLSTGQRAQALAELDRSEQAGGDRASVLIARRYTQLLGGAQIRLDQAAAPEELMPSLSALNGISSAQRGDWKSAAESLGRARTGLHGGPTAEPLGLRMTFEVKRPLEPFRAKPTSRKDLFTLRTGEKWIGGEVQFQPDQQMSSVSYVSFDLDGETLGLVNTPPFQFTWDSRRARNGRHRLNIVLYDNSGVEISRISHLIRLNNPGGTAYDAATEGRATALRARLWEALTLVPARAACAYQEGRAQLALGSRERAKGAFLLAAAIQPDYHDVRRQLALCGGISSTREAMWGGLRGEKLIALTFDDGPKPGLTEPLLQMLVEARVPATFFVIGQHVDEYPELTRLIVSSGMELANHSYTHPNLKKLSRSEVERELLQTQSAIFTATGKLPAYVRPPGGNWNSLVAGVAREWGMTPCMWTVDVYGSEVVGAQQVADAVLGQVSNGSIILMHNGKLSTMQALPVIIRELRRRGYQFVTVQTLAARLNQARDNNKAIRLNEAMMHRTE